LSLLLIPMLAPTLARAQSTIGRVESIGFGGFYRSGTWTPLRIDITPGPDTPSGTYEIRIAQRDPDGDRASYATPITLTAGLQQRFFAYFIPEPVADGLPNTADGATANELARRLRVTLHRENGDEVATLSVAGLTLQNLDTSRGSRARSVRFVLMVPAAARPPTAEVGPAANADQTRLLRVHEDLFLLPVNPTDLPDRDIGYHAVDDIVWLDGDIRELSAGGSTQLAALQDWLRSGGHLLLSTPSQWQLLSAFGDLLPVDIRSIETKSDFDPLLSLANKRPFSRQDPSAPASNRQLPNPWDRLDLTPRFARATLRNGAWEEIPIIWNRADADVANPNTPTSTDSSPAEDRSPWLARKAFGHGTVSWVASDLSTFRRATYGWFGVWPVLLGATRTGDSISFWPQPVEDASNAERGRWSASTGGTDLGASLLESMSLRARSTALVGLSILFFACYWIVAGPGIYLYLRHKKRLGKSWFAFGAAAVFALLLTLGLVRLVLRGPADMRHISVVRVDLNDTAPLRIISRIGLYMPRDGLQTLSLGQATSAQLFPFPSHARFSSDILTPRPLDYRVEVDPRRTTTPTTVNPDTPSATLDVPYRSSMKRIMARWNGSTPLIISSSKRNPTTNAIESTTVGVRLEGPPRIEGRPRRSTRPPFLTGTLRNNTGVDLRDIWIAFPHALRSDGFGSRDQLLYIPSWNDQAELDITSLFSPEDPQARQRITLAPESNLQANQVLAGELVDWCQWLFYREPVRPGIAIHDGNYNDANSNNPLSIPLLSLFSRLPPMEPGSNLSLLRAELHRSGARDLDAASVLRNGQLLVIAHANDQPLPFDFRVNGTPVKGTGRVIYQFAVPLRD
jgi:hypothetical protein